MQDTIKKKEHFVLSIDLDNFQSVFSYSKFENSFNSNICKDFKKGEFIQYEYISNRFLGSKYIFNNDWVLHNEQKEILGYQCQKASLDFGGRKWEAWYALDLPFGDGPYKFSGLPGVILEIFSEDGEYSFLAKGLTKVEKNIPKPNAAIMFTNKEKKDALKKEMIKDPATLYRQDIMGLGSKGFGLSVQFNGREITQKEMEEMREKSFLEWQKTHNNPIEKGDIWIK